MFTVLPSGLTTVCYVFTKSLWPVVKYLCTRGVQVVVYIDNGIVVDTGQSDRRRLHDDASYEYGDFCIRLHRGDAAFRTICFHQKRRTL